MHCLQKDIPTLLSVLYKHEKADQVHCIALAWMFIVKIAAIIIKNTSLITMFSPYPNLQSAVSQATDQSRESADLWNFFIQNMNHC